MSAKYKVTQTVTQLTPGKAYSYDTKEKNSVTFIVDTMAASNGFVVNGARLPQGTHTFGASDPYGVMQDILDIQVPAVSCIVTQIVTTVRFI